MAALANAARGYVWEDPGDSIMIQVNLEVIERLGAAIQHGLGPGSRGVETGGILLGSTLPGPGRAVLVDDFELMPCEHLRGASYTLSPKDKRVLGNSLARRGGHRVVGYFRSHTRPGMYLDQDDFAVFSQYFPEPWQVFMLVKPSTDGVPTGGFFFWEDGEVNRRSPYRTFPFDSARIAQGDYPITGGRPAVPIEKAMDAAPRSAPVLVRKPDPNAPRTVIRTPAWGHKLPSLPWVVVPVIAVLFLIAGLFVSEKPPVPVQSTAATSVPPVEPLLPEPVSEVKAPAAANPQAPVTPPVAASPTAGEPTPSVTALPAIPQPRRKPRLTTVAPPPAQPARAPAREIEAPLPPALTGPEAKVEPRFSILPTKVSAPPPPEAEVTYEAPRPGVFRRALHKIEGTEGEPGAFVPPSPIRRVAPMKPALAEARLVDVKVYIDNSGAVSKAQVIGKGGDLAAAALNAARQWQFKPARKQDKPVASEMVLHFRF